MGRDEPMDVESDERLGCYRNDGGRSTGHGCARVDRGDMASQSPAQAIDGYAGFGTLVINQAAVCPMPVHFFSERQCIWQINQASSRIEFRQRFMPIHGARNRVLANGFLVPLCRALHKGTLRAAMNGGLPLVKVMKLAYPKAGARGRLVTLHRRSRSGSIPAFKF